MKLLFLTPGCFDKGGISRYSRYQIKAWREILGEENVHVLSLLGPDENSFEEAFPVTFSAGGVAWMHKIRFTAMAAREAPKSIHAVSASRGSEIVKATACLSRRGGGGVSDSVSMRRIATIKPHTTAVSEDTEAKR